MLKTNFSGQQNLGEHKILRELPPNDPVPSCEVVLFPRDTPPLPAMVESPLHCSFLSN